MTRALATLVFTGETLFHLKEDAAGGGKTPAKDMVVLADSLPDADREFLLKIMASVGISEEKMEIISRARFAEYHLPSLQQAKQLVVFGDFPELTLPPEKYRLTADHDRKILRADALSTIGLNQAGEKRNLWNALKEMFGLS